MSAARIVPTADWDSSQANAESIASEWPNDPSTKLPAATDSAGRHPYPAPSSSDSTPGRGAATDSSDLPARRVT